MRLPLAALVTTAAGCAVVTVGLLKAPSAPLTALALLAAAAIASDVVENSMRGRPREPVDEEPLRVAASIHVAAAILVGPWLAALVAAGGMVAARGLRGAVSAASAFEASAFAVATFAGGEAFVAIGGRVGQLRLLEDLGPLLGLALAYVTVRTLLLELVDAGEPFHPNLPTAAAETGLGAAVAILTAQHPWDAVVLLPIALAVNRAYARAALLRRETLRALETFADVVDERDPSTYRHSIRVASYVDSLARALRLPFSDVDRLRWAARLHDLGKVAVDAAVLAKPTGLTADEWAAVRRHPRLSARLLQRFQFSTAEARAVELHHERVDGRGYYGVAAADLPLASHFLAVADSFDAMTTDRPYRRGLSEAEALEEIERNIGTQFHPAVAKAFVAVRRGLDPFETLDADEASELRAAPARYRLAAIPGGGLKQRPELLALAGTVIALAGLGFGQTPVAVVGGVAAVAGLLRRTRVRGRSARLAAELRTVLASAAPAHVLGITFDLLRRDAAVQWAALVSWRDFGLGGRVELELGDGPPEADVVSWLVREAESGLDLIAARGSAFGREGIVASLPLRRENSAVIGFFVVAADHGLPPFVEDALRKSLDALVHAFDGVLARLAPDALPRGGARVVRQGDDVSLISVGPLTPAAIEATAEAILGGLSVEVLEVEPGPDLRVEPVLASAGKTARVVIVGNGGLDLELAATLSNPALVTLDAPPVRLPEPSAAELLDRLGDLGQAKQPA